MSYTIVPSSERARKLKLLRPLPSKPLPTRPLVSPFPFQRMMIGESFFLEFKDVHKGLLAEVVTKATFYNRKYAYYFVVLKYTDKYEVARIA